MKKYFKNGIGVLIPISLVFIVFSQLYDFINKIVLFLLPNSLQYQWWFVFPLLIAVVIIILLIGLIFSHIEIVKWFKKKFDNIVNKIPLVGTVYKFGIELVDNFIVDIKQNGEKLVVEIVHGGQKRIGLLSNEEMKIVFVPSWPNPLNGNGFKVNEYKVLGKMKMKDFLKLVGSLGTIGGEKWVSVFEEIEKKEVKN